ncbi:MAG: hypothetical protein J3K34DRAFT_402606 [Monoraphidium minutum]|nr:MAG: hypothetical protein J3K34DRAFT_402606 [Monoraphidium minutum]
MLLLSLLLPSLLLTPRTHVLLTACMGLQGAAPTAAARGVRARCVNGVAHCCRRGARGGARGMVRCCSMAGI